jgi:hypothetical protein
MVLCPPMPQKTSKVANNIVAPVQASLASDPEFLDAAGLQARFGIKRSLAYALLGDGVIKGVSLRRRGQSRGKRLFSVDSVRRFLNSRIEAEGQQ